jgi:hypothetical protein
MESMKDVVMPIQPIKDGRFVKNRIVERLLEVAPIDLNEIAFMDFTVQERMQFAQLIGYSLNGFSELGYVDDETYSAALGVANGISEDKARNIALREQLLEVKKGLMVAAVAAFEIHEDDLE